MGLIKCLTVVILILGSTFTSPETISTTEVISIEEKEKHCKVIFDKLKRARGLLGAEKPTLSMKERLPNPRFKLAMANPTTGLITIEEGTYDLCMTMGDDAENALAFILAHELSHFTRKHNVRT